jgi:AraC-like DNA-binding protein
MNAAPANSAQALPHCLHEHRLFTSHDLDDTRQRISAIMQPHTLRPNGHAGTSSAFMDFVPIAGIGVGAIGFGTAMHVDVGRLDGYHLLMFCLRGQASALADDQLVEVDQQRGMLSGPGRPFVADLSQDCEQFVMRLSRDAIQAHTGFCDLRFQPAVDLSRAALQPWLAQARLLVSSSSLLRLVQKNALIAGEMERLLIQLLLAGQPWQPLEHQPARDRVVSPACVRKAEAYMEAHAGLPIRLGEIAAAAGVPARTLLEAFQRFRQNSPMQRLKEMRLERAHALLRAADDATTVADIALDCGFAHFGRFSQAYRRRFGCAPSASLKRRRG